MLIGMYGVPAVILRLSIMFINNQNNNNNTLIITTCKMAAGSGNESITCGQILLLPKSRKIT